MSRDSFGQLAVEIAMWNVLRRFDRQIGEIARRCFEQTMIGEAIFAPSEDGKGEDDGYLLTYAFDGDVTRLFVLRASDITAEPVAVLRLPQRVPSGLHGCWLPLFE